MTALTPSPSAAPVENTPEVSAFTSASKSTPTARRHGNPLINRGYALLVSGQAVSILGDIVFTTTVAVWVGVILAHGQAWAALAVSGALVAAAVPSLLLAPLAGVFVDRWDKRRTMIVMDAIRAVAILALLAVPFFGAQHWSPLIQLLVVYGVVFFVNSCQQFFQPAMLALINDLVPEELQPRAMGLAQASVSVGPPLATLALFAVGMQWALLFNALSFVVSCATVLAIRAPRHATRATSTAKRSVAREFGAGLRFYFGNRTLRTLTIVIVIAMLGAGAFQALDIFFVTQNLHTAPAYYGLLETAQGLGMLIGAIAAGVFAARLGLTRTIWLSLVLVGALALVYARLTSFLPAAILLFVLGIPLAGISVACEPLVLRVTPRELLGRVNALLTPMTTLAGMLAAAVAGYLDSAVLRSFHAALLGQHFGPIDTIFVAAGFVALLGGLYALVGLRGTPPSAANDEASASVSVSEQVLA